MRLLDAPGGRVHLWPLRNAVSLSADFAKFLTNPTEERRKTAKDLGYKVLQSEGQIEKAGNESGL